MSTHVAVERTIEDAKGMPNRQLVADYSYWFWNWR